MVWIALDGRSIGTKYLTDDRGCQDWACSAVLPDRAILVICDGAGSARYSHLGARATAEAIFDFFKTFDDFSLTEQELLKRLLSVLARNLSLLVKTHEAAQADFDTTLLFVCQSFTNDVYWAGHVGDGMILALTKSKIEILSESMVGDQGSNFTYFVRNVFSDRSLLRLYTGKPLNGFICFSDGVEDAVLLKRRAIKNKYKDHQRAPIHPWVTNLITHCLNFTSNKISYELEKLIASGKTNDDCSIAFFLDDKFIKKINYEDDLIFFDCVYNGKEYIPAPYQDKTEDKPKETLKVHVTLETLIDLTKIILISSSIFLSIGLALIGLAIACLLPLIIIFY